MNILARIPTWIASHWRATSVMVACGVGIAATCKWCLESEEARAQRLERRRKKELRALADRISAYGRNVHQRYPTGDVVVSERDLAEQLRKRPDIVATALNVLLGEQKVQKAPLNGYWKLQSRPASEDSPPGNVHGKSGIQLLNTKRLRWLFLMKHTALLLLKVSASSFEELTAERF